MHAVPNPVIHSFVESPNLKAVDLTPTLRSSSLSLINIKVDFRRAQKYNTLQTMNQTNLVHDLKKTWTAEHRKKKERKTYVYIKIKKQKSIT